MVDILGTQIATPKVDITGFISNSWIYVLIIAVVGFLLLLTVGVILFYKTYSRKIVIFEQGAEGLVPKIKTRARVINLKEGGLKVMKLLAGGDYAPAYSKTMGKNSYWFERGTDGYLRNFVLDKYGSPYYIDGDMRMFHGAIDRYSQNTYGSKNTFEKVMMIVSIFIFLIILVIGGWMLIGKIGDATKSLAETSQTNEKVAESNLQVVDRLTILLNENPDLFKKNGIVSGLVPAS